MAESATSGASLPKKQAAADEETIAQRRTGWTSVSTFMHILAEQSRRAAENYMAREFFVFITFTVIFLWILVRSPTFSCSEVYTTPQDYG